MLKLQHISKTFKNYPVLTNINLSVEQGEMIAIKGSSGAGKSTLLQILGFLDKPTSGSYLLNGQETAQLSLTQLATLRQKHIGFVLQHFALIEEETALFNVSVPLYFTKHSIFNIRGLAYKQLEDLKLDHLANKKVAKLSGGEKQRVAIARALITNPPIILADEPTGALDSKTTSFILEQFTTLNKQGKTIIIVTHEDVVANACNRVLSIEDGQIVETKS